MVTTRKPGDIMVNCTHSVDDIARIDCDEYVIFEDTLLIWGECECGAPTIVCTTIDTVTPDTEGTTLEEFKNKQAEFSDPALGAQRASKGGRRDD